jgi:hypothetical protein
MELWTMESCTTDSFMLVSISFNGAADITIIKWGYSLLLEVIFNKQKILVFVVM